MKPHGFLGAGGTWSATAAASFTSATTVPLDTEVEASGGVVRPDLITNHDLEILVPGRYMLVADWNADNDASTARSVARGFLELDTGGGFSTLAHTSAYFYCRTSAQGEGGGSRTRTLRLKRGDKIRSQIQLHAGSATLVTLATGCSITAVYLSP